MGATGDPIKSDQAAPAGPSTQSIMPAATIPPDSLGPPDSPAVPVALITGGTGGLGQAVTGAFLERGYRVIVTARRATGAATLPLQESFPGAGAMLALEPADLTDGEQVASLIERVIAAAGRIDCLINLAGAWTGGRPLWETPEAEWDQMLAVNLRSTMLCCRATLPHMVRQQYGRVVNVSSRTAVHPTAGAAAYAVSKAGVVTLTETLALEVRDHDINVNCVLPSVIDTPANRQSMPHADASRWVTPHHLAAIIAWLTSPDATPINGAAIPVYGRA